MKKQTPAPPRFSSALFNVAFKQLRGAAAFLVFTGAVAPGITLRAETPKDLSRSPHDWAVEVAANEVAVLDHKGSYLRYRMHMVDAKGEIVRDTFETKDGTVARLILREGKRLSPEEDAAERQRLNDMLASPAAFFRHIKNEDSGRSTAAELIRMMPDAMLYTYTPGQPQTGAQIGTQTSYHGAAQAIVLDYHPNPAWNPPTTTSAALTGMEGRMWIDPRSHQMLRMEGHIFKPVNFGWGMLAHIYPGGELMLDQTDAGGGRWIYRHFSQRVTVRALMVKMVNVHADVDASHFQAVRPLGYQEAIRELLATPLPAQ